MRFFSSVFLLFLLSSCIKEIPINMPGLKNQTVVGSIIYPGKLISINADFIHTFTDSLNLEKPKILNIKIFENGELIDRPTGLGPEFFSSVYPKQGSKYGLTVITESDTLTAETSIPVLVPIKDAEYRISDFTSQSGDQMVQLSISWDDPAQLENFYELMLLGESQEPYTRYRYDEIDDLILLKEGDLDYEPTSFVLSDRQFDGETAIIQFKYPITVPSQIDKDRYVLLRSISREYYHFMKSWYRHFYLQNTSMNVEMITEDLNIFPLLFQGDPIPLYSNVNNGFGIFAGYSEDIRKFKLIR